MANALGTRTTAVRVCEMLPRHEGHHHGANIKYGHYVFAVLLLHAVLIYLAQYIYFKRWSYTKNPRLWRFLTSVPLIVKVTGWAAVILALGFYGVDLNESYTSIKRFGRLSYCLIPLDVFLVLRTNRTIVTYLEVLDLHKWLSRLIVVAGIIHSIGYFTVWFIEGTLVEKLMRLLNFYGVVVFVAFLVLLAMLVLFVRRRAYRWFYVVHNSSVVLFIYLVALHARPGVTKYTVGITALLLGQYVIRLFSSVSVDNLHISTHPGLSLLVVKIPRHNMTWAAASHVRISFPRHSLRHYFLPLHPYTIASLPEDNCLTLVVKPSTFKFDTTSSYSVSGPYPALPIPFLNTCETVHILCGGSGISFGAAIFKALQNRPISISLTWCIRTPADGFILEHLGISASAVTIHVTGVTPGAESGGDDATATLLSNQETADDIELQLLDKAEVSGVPYKRGRPHLSTVFETPGDVTNTYVVACGPETLVADCRAWAAEHKVNFLLEVYAM